jgi:hypothetical protein
MLKKFKLRARRVKCDETKPTCIRCLDYETECAGYKAPKKKARNFGKLRSRLIPLLPCNDDSYDLSLRQPSPDFSFPSDAHGRYFLIFRDDVVPELTGLLRSSVWNRIILQSCHWDSYVRDAVIALAALKESLSPASSAASKDLSGQHYSFALCEYGKAIRNMRETLAVSNEAEKIRKALVGCLLVFCFESFQGSRDIAISHAKSGYQLLQDWLARYSPSSTRTNTLSSPDPTVVEDDLLHAFYRLDLQIMTIDASRPSELHNTAQRDGADIVAHMPSSFSDLDEAHRYWVLVMRRNHHFVHAALAEARGPCKNKIRESADKIGALIHRDYPSEQRTLREEHSSYTAELTRWQKAFMPLLSCPNRTTYPGAALLQIHCLSSQANLDMLVTRKSDFASYTEKFREIVLLARSIIAATSGSARSTSQSFSIDFGIIPSLLVVIYLCQDEALCNEARSVLYSTDRREGVWNTVHLARKDKGSRWNKLARTRSKS